MRQILYIISILALTICSPLGVVYTAIKNAVLFRYKTWLKTIINYFLVVIIALDQCCNVLYQDILTDLAVKEEGFIFGNPDHTLGHTIRKNVEKDKLTLFGKFIQIIIDHKKK